MSEDSTTPQEETKTPQQQPVAPKRKRRRFKLVLVSLAIGAFVVVVGGLLLRTSETPPQVITLPNGIKIQFLGVTYGTNHVLGSTASRLVHRLPKAWETHVRKILGSRLSPIIVDQKTPAPFLCIWFQPLSTNAPRANTQVFSMLTDGNDIEAGTQSLDLPGFFGRPVRGSFRVVPRRSRELQVIFYKPDLNSEIARVRFPNPLYGRYPQWKPEPVPAVKSAGDVEVRLENFMTTGRAGPHHRLDRRGETEHIVFDFSFKSPRGTNEEWVTHGAELSDATGNILTTFRASGGAGYREYIYGTLWPDEAAWRLKVEVKRTSGYEPGELVTFKGVPVPKTGGTNVAPITNIVGGVQVVLHSGYQVIYQPGIISPATMQQHLGYSQSAIVAELPGSPKGVAVDIVSVTSNVGGQVEDFTDSRRTRRRSYHTVALEDVPVYADVKTVDVTLAVQKTRTVEFFVAPPKTK